MTERRFTGGRVWSALKGFRVPRTRLTRTLAALLAFALIGALAYFVDAIAGNPVSLRLAQHAVVRHFEEEHAGEGYVVGPMRYIGQRPMRYVCRVYREGSEDTGFSAYVENGTVCTTEAAETLSGSNTYNRFRNELSAAYFTEDTTAALREAGMGQYGSLVDFLAFGENVFDPADPVFVQDSAFRLNALPLPAAVCVEFSSEDLSDEALAACLTLLYEQAQKNDVPFDYYSATVYDPVTCDRNSAYDVPANIVADAGELARYLAEEPRVTMEQAEENSAFRAKILNLNADGAWLPCE